MVQTAKNFSLIGFIKLARIGNLLIIVFAQYITSIFLTDQYTYWKNYFTDISLFLLSLSSVLIAASGYLINDYYDVKIDYINKPERVVVGKVIKRRVVMVAHTVINFFGIIIGLIVSPFVAILNFGSALLLWLYSNQLKRLPLIGNFAVGLLTGLSIYIVAILYNSTNVYILVYALFAVGYTIIRELIKDMEDVKGDEAFGCNTFPVAYGLRASKIFLYIFILVFGSGISLMLYINYSPSTVPLLIGNGLMLIALLMLITKADTKVQFHRLSTITKLMMLIGIVSMILI